MGNLLEGEAGVARIGLAALPLRLDDLVKKHRCLSISDAFPDGNILLREMRGDALVCPRASVVPVPSIADSAIEMAVRLDGGGRETDKLNRGVRVG